MNFYIITTFFCRESDIEAQDVDNDTPLLTAVEYGSSACVKVLLDRGANIKACDRNDQTVLHIAAKYNEIETIEVSVELCFCFHHIWYLM